MSKDKLHEIVQKEYRTLPAYTFAKNGPDQAPQFRAFVSFCGLTFQSPGFYRTVRQAENAAADVALEALSAKPDDEPMQTNELVQTNGPMQADGPAVTGMLGKRQRIEVFQQPEERISTPQFLPDTQKSQLQDYAKKSGFDLPVYFCVCEETSCVAGFKATVKFNGQTYESPGLFNSMRQAEHAAAAVVLKSLSERGPTLVAPPMYKNYLQIKAQKEGRPLPAYNTTMSGQSHAPVFTSTVNFNGMTFEGKAAKSKKQAENNAAASAASFALKDLGVSAVSAVQVNDDKGKAPICDLNDNLLIQVINHLKEQTTRVESCVSLNNYPKTKRVAFKRQVKKVTMEVSRLQKLIVTIPPTIGGWDNIGGRVQPSTGTQNNSYRHSASTRACIDRFRGRRQFRGCSRGRQQLRGRFKGCSGGRVGRSGRAPTLRNEISARVQQEENAQNGIVDIGSGWNTPGIGDPPTTGWDGWGVLEDTSHIDHSSIQARVSRSRSRAPSHSGGCSGWVPPPRNDKHFPMLELAISPVRARVQEENVQNEVDIGLGWSLPDAFDPSASGSRGWKNFDDKDPPPSVGTIAPGA